MGCYDVIYMLKPDYEDIKNGGKDWWKLKWRPIWRETYSIYCRKRFSGFNIGITYNNSDARNGWHRYYKHRHLRIGLLLWEFEMWIRYDFIVHKDGPSDATERKPLSIIQNMLANEAISSREETRLRTWKLSPQEYAQESLYSNRELFLMQESRPAVSFLRRI